MWPLQLKTHQASGVPFCFFSSVHGANYSFCTWNFPCSAWEFSSHFPPVLSQTVVWLFLWLGIGCWTLDFLQDARKAIPRETIQSEEHKFWLRMFLSGTKPFFFSLRGITSVCWKLVVRIKYSHLLKTRNSNMSELSLIVGTYFIQIFNSAGRTVMVTSGIQLGLPNPLHYTYQTWF